jgi:rhamnogalacturonan endolyase
VTFWGNPGIILLYDGAGHRLNSFEPSSTGHVLNPVNWTGDGQELSLLHAGVREGGLIDGHGRRAVLFPDDGHPDICCEAVNLTGDARDELVVWDHQRIFIYTQDRPFAGPRIYSPLRQPLWNASNYRAEVSLPHWTPLG